MTILPYSYLRSCCKKLGIASDKLQLNLFELKDEFQ